MSRTWKSFLSTAALACLCTSSVAMAADDDHGWSRYKGDIEQSNQATKFGPKCKSEFTSRGTADVGFGITQYWAKRHAKRHWEEAAVKLYGAEFGKWGKAKGTSVSCEKSEKVWLCKATGSACS